MTERTNDLLLNMRKKARKTVNQMKEDALELFKEERKESRCLTASYIHKGSITCEIMLRKGNIRYDHFAYNFYVNGKKTSCDDVKKLIG